MSLGSAHSSYSVEYFQTDLSRVILSLHEQTLVALLLMGLMSGDLEDQIKMEN